LALRVTCQTMTDRSFIGLKYIDSLEKIIFKQESYPPKYYQKSPMEKGNHSN